MTARVCEASVERAISLLLDPRGDEYEAIGILRRLLAERAALEAEIARLRALSTTVAEWEHRGPSKQECRKVAAILRGEEPPCSE